MPRSYGHNVMRTRSEMKLLNRSRGTNSFGSGIALLVFASTGHLHISMAQSERDRAEYEVIVEGVSGVAPLSTGFAQYFNP